MEASSSPMATDLVAAPLPAVGETTGRYLITFEEDAVSEAPAVFEDLAGIQTFSAESEEPRVRQAAAETGAAVVFEQLGVAAVEAPPAQIGALGASIARTEALRRMEPERIVYALEASPSGDYLRGFAAAAQFLSGLRADAPEPAAVPVQPADESQVTWGLQITQAVSSSFDGAGTEIAILDTGFDEQHPDFVGRSVGGESQIPGEPLQDGNGHGTHCIGTACGGSQPEQGPRYGIASAAQITVQKVLSNAGRGQDGGILAGLNAAVAARCTVASMSLGAPVSPGQAPSPAFETAARRALAQGTVIVAAAGNDSDRTRGAVRPVSHPANCPSILAVAAVDRDEQVAFFSNGGLNPGGGQVDVAAPGVDVYSSAPMPGRYRRLSGTSMATPHVAGILALLRQAHPDATATELVAMLARGAKRLSASSADVGAGLVQAPQ
jgi:subtilisin